jgi:hypothetical protein
MQALKNLGLDITRATLEDSCASTGKAAVNRFYVTDAKVRRPPTRPTARPPASTLARSCGHVVLREAKRRGRAHRLALHCCRCARVVAPG